MTVVSEQTSRVAYRLHQDNDLVDEKHEYEAGVLIPMTGGTSNHNRVMGNVYTLLDIASETAAFQVWNSETRVRTPDSSRYYYPDVSVTAGDPVLDPAWKTATLLNPCLVVEVLSPATRERDTGSKFAGYQRIPTLAEYLLIDPERVHVVQWVRQPDDSWHAHEYTRLSDTIALAGVPATLPLQRVYRRVLDSADQTTTEDA